MKLIDRLLVPLAVVFAVACIATTARGLTLYQNTVAANAQSKQDGIELPILMYHHILKDQARLNAYTITPDAFRADLDWLISQGYTPIVMADLLAYTQNEKPLPAHPVMITFDDGYESFYQYVFPILQEKNVPAVFSVVGRYVDQYSETDDHHITYSHSTWEQLRQMQESGLVEIQNHSYNLHTSDGKRRGAKKNPGESETAYQQALSLDLERLQKECAKYLNKRPTTFTFPFGYISAEAYPILKAMGFEAALSCEEKLNYITGDPEQLFHLRRFNRPNGTSAQQILQRAGASPLKPASADSSKPTDE